jgi:hypothetical protein
MYVVRANYFISPAKTDFISRPDNSSIRLSVLRISSAHPLSASTSQRKSRLRATRLIMEKPYIWRVKVIHMIKVAQCFIFAVSSLLNLFVVRARLLLLRSAGRPTPELLCTPAAQRAASALSVRSSPTRRNSSGFHSGSLWQAVGT